ncbi:MAG: phosphate ABC transporter substrate-binding protein [Cellulosilyticaceae bacterium]
MKKLVKVGALLLTLSLALAGCASKSDAASVITFAGSSTLAPVVSKLGEDFSAKHPDVTFQVSSGGSGQGVQAVIDQTANFGMVARSVKDDEKVKIQSLETFNIGIDALTIAVNPENPLLTLKDNLTKDEIMSLFSGQYAKWSDFDASLPAEEIVVVTRDIGGGAHEVFQSKIMGDTEVKADAIQAPSMGALVEKIIENPYAIGYASFGVAQQNEGKITTLQVDGIAPTAQNILTGSYMIQRPLILIKSGSLSASEQSFMDYVLSDEGATTIETLGFIVP